MIPYIYKPVLFSLGSINIYTWGLFAALAFFFAYFYIFFQNKSKKILNLCIYILLGAIIGARLLNFFSNPYDSILHIFELWEGGLDIYGGFLGGFIFGLIYIKKNKLRFWKTADILAPAIVLAIAIGRIGCTLGDGGHLGKSTNFFLGTLVNGVVRHYTAVYSVIALFILFILLLILRKKKPFTGFLFIFSMIYYSIVRFLIDLTRIDSTYSGLTIAQYGCIGLFIISSILLIRKFKI